MPPKTARQLDRFSQFGLVAGQLALADAGLEPGSTPERPRPSGPGSTSAARSAGSPTPRSSTRSTWSAASGPWPRTSRSRCSAARRPRTSASRSACAGRSSRPRTRAPPARSRSARRSGPSARARSTRPSRAASRCRSRPLAFGAFDIIRALSGGHNDDPAGAGRPFDRDRDGFVMGEGAALLVLEAEDVARGRGAEPYAELLGYGASSDAHHMVQPRPDGTEAARAVSIALAGAGLGAGRDRLRERACVLDADRRRRRGAGADPGARGARVDRAGQRHEGAVRPPAGRIRCDRGGDLLPRDPRFVGAADGQPARRRTPTAPRCCRGCSASRLAGELRHVLSTSFGFGGLNAALVFGKVA